MWASVACDDLVLQLKSILSGILTLKILKLTKFNFFTISNISMCFFYHNLPHLFHNLLTHLYPCAEEIRYTTSTQ